MFNAGSYLSVAYIKPVCVTAWQVWSRWDGGGSEIPPFCVTLRNKKYAFSDTDCCSDTLLQICIHL